MAERCANSDLVTVFFVLFSLWNMAELWIAGGRSSSVHVADGDLHTVRFRPLTLGLLFSVVFSGENNEPRPMMYIALTYDHRLIDGKEVRQTLLGN
jgi:hypothetical protein